MWPKFSVKARSIASVLVIFVVGCNEPESISIAEQGIVSGSLSGREDDAVVAVISPDVYCSGTLIAPNLVLTARHCIAVVDRVSGLACTVDGDSANGKGDITKDYDESQISITVGPGSSAYRVFKPKRFISTHSPTVCRNDLALIVLEEPIEDMPFMPVRLLRQTTVGETMTIVGFGQAGMQGEQVQRHRREGVKVLRVGPNSFDEQGGQAVRGTFVVGQGPCKGDSGGPAIAESTGAVAGVYSIMATDDCTSPTATGVYVQIAEYRDLFEEAFDAVSAVPWLEGSAAPAEPEPSQSCAMQRPKGGTHRYAACVLGGLLFAALRRRKRSRFAVVRRRSVAPNV